MTQGCYPSCGPVVTVTTDPTPVVNHGLVLAYTGMGQDVALLAVIGALIVLLGVLMVAYTRVTADA